MKKRTLVIAMTAAAVISVACTKNENSETTETPLAVQQDTGIEKLDIMWCHLDERSDVKDKGAVMDMFWHLYGSDVLLISEPGNPDVGVVRCDDPGAAPLMARIRQVANRCPD